MSKTRGLRKNRTEELLTPIAEVSQVRSTMWEYVKKAVTTI